MRRFCLIFLVLFLTACSGLGDNKATPTLRPIVVEQNTEIPPTATTIPLIETTPYPSLSPTIFLSATSFSLPTSAPPPTLIPSPTFSPNDPPTLPPAVIISTAEFQPLPDPPTNIPPPTALVEVAANNNPPPPQTNNNSEVIVIPQNSNPEPIPQNNNNQPIESAQNLDFGAGQFKQDAVEINVPVGWQAWWREGSVDCTIYNSLPTDSPCPSDATYKRPEFTLISGSDSFFASRVRGEGMAARFFCTYGVCWGGYYQQVNVPANSTYLFSGYAYSWCSPDEAVNISKTDERDAYLNCEVAIGIDPNGGTNPYSPSIIWSTANIYDAYGFLQTPPVTASGGTITLFTRGRSLWGFKHIDFHFSDLGFTTG